MSAEYLAAQSAEGHVAASGAVAWDVSAFKLYDIRGVIGQGVSAGLYHRVARAAAETLRVRRAAVGFDARESSPNFARAALRGLEFSGVHALDLGLCGTEEVYDAVGAGNLDLGLMVTASHNPIEFNGLKLVGRGARPLSPEHFAEIRRRTEAGDFDDTSPVGVTEVADGSERRAYARRVADQVDAGALRGIKILFDCGSGAAGPTLRAVLDELASRDAEIDAEIIGGTPDPTFPGGVPNPLLPQNHGRTALATQQCGADFGVAFDGDFDRCSFFDGRGDFVEGEYAVALIARATLAREPAAAIVHDPRVTGAIRAEVLGAGGLPVQSLTGHAFVKETMRAADAPYGGEMSAHHYFRDFHSCDSGMIPWLKVAELTCAGGAPLAQLVSQMRRDYPSSGEINFTVSDKGAAVARVRQLYERDAEAVDRSDGLACDFGDWRFSLRASNTENLLRLNVEARGDRGLVEAKVADLNGVISKWGDPC